MSGLANSESPGASDTGLQPFKTEPKDAISVKPVPPSPVILVKIEVEDEPKIKEEYPPLDEELHEATLNMIQRNSNTYEDKVLQSEECAAYDGTQYKLEQNQVPVEFPLYEEYNIKEEMVIGLTEVISSDTKPPSELFETPKLLKERLLRCQNCNETFSCIRTLKRHMQSHMPGSSKSVYQKRVNINGDQKFPCDICGQVYQTRAYLVRHKVTHLKEKPFICNYCKKGFTQKVHLIEHIRVHTGEKPYPCDICNKCFSAKSQMIKHRIIHTNIHRQNPNSHACDFCGKMFATKGNVIRHKLTHVGKKPFQCILCCKRFTTKGGLNWHIKYHCSNTDIKDGKQFACQVCKSTFAYKPSLNYHMRVYHQEYIKPLTCNVCGEVYRRRSSLLRHKLTHLEWRPFICDICKKGFNQKSHLIGHLRTHAGVKPYTCDFCNKSYSVKGKMVKHRLIHMMNGPKTVRCKLCKEHFKNISELRLHKKTQHRQDMVYICEVCSKGFEQSSRLVRHMLTHSDRKQFACDQCDKTFVQKPHLDSHRLTHTGVKPFKCEICGKCFSRKTYMNTHVRSHTGQNLFPCEFCDKTFAWRTSLYSHKLTHQAAILGIQIQCSDCDRKFSHKNALRHHIDHVHRPARYICEFCDKPFYYKSDHDRHKEIHTGPKSHICSVCNLKFPSKKVLKNHECILTVYCDEKTELS